MVQLDAVLAEDRAILDQYLQKNATEPGGVPTSP
jgi:hypothetical protein